MRNHRNTIKNKESESSFTYIVKDSQVYFVIQHTIAMISYLRQSAKKVLFRILVLYILVHNVMD